MKRHGFTKEHATDPDVDGEHQVTERLDERELPVDAFKPLLVRQLFGARNRGHPSSSSVRHSARCSSAVVIWRSWTRSGNRLSSSEATNAVTSTSSTKTCSARPACPEIRRPLTTDPTILASVRKQSRISTSRKSLLLNVAPRYSSEFERLLPDFGLMWAILVIQRSLGSGSTKMACVGVSPMSAVLV